MSPPGPGTYDSEEHSAREKLGEEYNLSHNNSLYQWGEGRVKPQLSVRRSTRNTLRFTEFVQRVGISWATKWSRTACIPVLAPSMTPTNLLMHMIRR